MGWLFALGLAALTYLALLLSRRCSTLALELAGAAILVAMADYAWQGKPGMLGQPAGQTAPA